MLSLELLNKYSDVGIDIEARIAQTTLSVRDILALERSTVIRLWQPAGETVDVLIGGARIGRGEIVIAGDAVRVRIAALGEEA